MNRVKRKRVTKYADWVIARSAGLMFDSLQFFNKYKPNPSFIPKWSDKPVLKSWQKTKPTLGWPRETDSLCPGCVKEARDMILSGEEDWKTLEAVRKSWTVVWSSGFGMSRRQPER